MRSIPSSAPSRSATARRSPVAGQHRHLDDAVSAQARSKFERAYARRVGEFEPGDQSAVDADERAGIAGRHVSVDRLGSAVAGLTQERAASNCDAAACDRALDALARPLDDIERELERKPTLLCLPDERGRDRMYRGEVDRGREPQRLRLVEAVDAANPGQLRHSEGDGARLVEDHGTRVAEPFDHAAALDDNADAGRPRHAREQGDRRGEDQRAMGCDDEHGQRAHRIARH